MKYRIHANNSIGLYSHYLPVPIG